MYNPSIHNCILAYESNIADIDNFIYSIVLEADTASNQADSIEDSKESLISRISEKLKEIFKKLMAIIERTLSNLNIDIQKCLVSDKGFSKQLDDAIKNHNPKPSIKVIAYQYIDQVIDSQFVKLIHSIYELIDHMQLQDNLLNKEYPMNFERKDLEKYILEKLNTPSEISTPALYFQYLKKIFRGDKKELLIRGEHAKAYVVIATNYTPVKNQINNSSVSLKSKTNSLRNRLNILAKKNDIPDNIKKALIKQSSNVLCLYQLFQSLSKVYFDLKIEQMFNARAILKRLYQF